MAIASNFPSIKPSLLLDFANVGRLDPRITFTRASTGTYYDGVTTAKAEENLLLQSQDFTTSWTNQNSTETANTTAAPDGTTTADTITDDATNGGHFVFQSPSISTNTTYVFSCWLKAGTSNYGYLAIIDRANGQRYFVADFDLNAGTVRTSGAGTSGTLTSSSITEFPAGSGWYRCVIIGQVAAVSATTAALVGVSDGTAAINGFGAIAYAGTGSTIIAWGAQLEQRSAVSSYTATTTQAITNYIPVLLTAQANVARFDHNPTTGEALGLLIEEQRTNSLTYSADFADVSWIKERSSITSNIIVAPDGTLTGDKLVEDTTASNSHTTYKSVSGLTDNTTYIASFYLKAAERTKVVVALMDKTPSTKGMLFDLSAGTISSYNADGITDSSVYGIQSVGNGWYRCWVGNSVGTGGTNPRAWVQLTNGTTISYTGNGYSGVFIWGAQLEAGAFATSYIPTTTTALTRNADAASMTGTNFSSWYNASEGTLYAEASANGVVGGSFIASIQDSAATSYIRVRQNLAGGAVLGQAASSGGSTPGLAQTNFTVNVPFKIAIAAKASDVAVSCNAGTVETSSAMTLMPTVDRLAIASSGFYLVRRIAYYPLRATNAQLQALTG